VGEISAPDRAALGRLSTTVNQLVDGLCAIDVDGLVVLANPAMSTLVGMDDPTGLVAVDVLLRDVTLEREVGRMKTDFIATVSHELRTPLTSVLGFAKIMRGRLEKSVFPRVDPNDRRAVRAVD